MKSLKQNFKSIMLGNTRRLLTVLCVLTIGVGQMWGGYNVAWKGNVFFRVPDEWDISTYSTIQLAVARSTDTNTDTYIDYFGTMTRVGSTRLYYLNLNADHSSWNQNEYLFFTANSYAYDKGTFKINNNHYYTTPTTYVCNNASTYYLLNPDGEDNGVSVTGSYAASRDAVAKKDQKVYLYTNGSESKTGGSVRIDGIYFTGDKTTESSDVTNTTNNYATYGNVIGASVSLTATPSTGYQFDGWYTAGTGGSLASDENPYTYTCTGERTVYARFSALQSAITLDKNGGDTGGSATATYDNNSLSSISEPARTGYSVEGYYTSSNCTTKVATSAGVLQNSITVDDVAWTDGSGLWKTTTDETFYTKWQANEYDVILDVNGATTGSNQTVVATYDAAMQTKQKTSGDAITAPSKTGYTFGGYWENSNGTGTQYYTSGLASNHIWDVATNETSIYAKWTANPYTVTLDVDEDNHGNIASATTSQDVTYDAATTTVPARPTAANGYALAGYYTDQNGGGTKVINADGTWIASVTGYTDASKHWVHDGNVTLYAYYQKAEITALTLDATRLAPGATVGATPTIAPEPTGTTIICWYVLHGNDNPLVPQPTITWDDEDGKATFDAPTTGGTYKVRAILRTGSSCGAGTALDTTDATFNVAAEHTVTVQYKDASGNTIQESGSVTGKPLEWSDEAITPPEIIGYSFARWSAGDGVTLTADDGATTATDTSVAAIKIKAIYDGYLTATYTQKSLIYFKNTLGWSDVYVNFYTGSYWNNPKGSGNENVANKNKHMTRIGETDVWYYDYGTASITPSDYVSFTSSSQDGSKYFWGSSGGVNVVYPANYPDDIHTDKSRDNSFKAATPMFVPVRGQEAVVLNDDGSGKANYYNAGYWTKYTSGTGYTLEIYNNTGATKLKSIDFTSSDELMPMKAVANLEANQTYKFQFVRGGDAVYYTNGDRTMTYSNHGQSVAWEFTNPTSFSKTNIMTNAAGDYTFNLSYSPWRNGSTDKDEYRLRMSVDYPIAEGDYRLVYKDNVDTRGKASAIVTKVNNGKDTVSFFVRPGSTPILKIQQSSIAENGVVTWNDYSTISDSVDNAGKNALPQDSVYDICLTMNESGVISVDTVKAYTGNYYIRTDAANSKWDNYRGDPDHTMTYSEYSINHGGYSHYYCHWVKYDDANHHNVKFCIANDYSPSISDTLTRETASGAWANIGTYIDSEGNLQEEHNANVRFMWNRHNNTISRAYVDGAQNVGSDNFLYMLNDEGSDPDKIKWSDGTALTSHKITFTDKGNWIYEANIKAKPNAQIKLLSNWGTGGSAITQYFKGSSSTTETLMSGDEDDDNWYDVRVLYDYKTNRLVAALLPSGEITRETPINADVMFVRDHQGDIAQLTFTGDGAITEIETAYAVLRFNKWTLNNKSTAEGHAPLANPKSRYERDIYYVSFPFRVSMEDVFGFGTYGKHWIIEEYDGAGRAANGYWLESGPNWKFITNRKGRFFEPYIGYIIALDLDELGETSDVWTNTDQVELYFPSYGAMDNITSSTVNCTIPAHQCTIDRSAEIGGNGEPLGAEYNRTIKDSHWNVISVPTYVNTSNITFANTTWRDSLGGPNFLYEWNKDDNSVTIRRGDTYIYMAMHAYLVQYHGVITWTASVNSPATAPRRNPAYRGEYECRLELQQNEQIIDQTYIRLMDDEHVTNGFEFNYDASKEFNRGKANIYTLIGSEPVAGNCMPMSNETTVVPVGVKIATDGEYTFSLPDGTEGVGVVLIDNATNTRTNLGLTDYSVYLEAGNTEGRFVLEIPAISQTTTDINDVQGDDVQGTKARKMLIDGMLYIVKDGKVFDARGARVE